MLTYLANPSPAPRGGLPTDRTGLVVLVILVVVGVFGVIWLRRTRPKLLPL